MSASSEITDSVGVPRLQQSLQTYYFIQEKDHSNKKYKIKLSIEDISKNDLHFWKEEKKNYPGIEITGKFIEIYIPNLYEETVYKIYIRKLFKRHVPFFSPKKVNIFEECENKYIKCLYKRKTDYLTYLAKIERSTFQPAIVVIIGDFAIKPENCEVNESCSPSESVKMEVDNDVEYIDRNSNFLD